MIDDILQIENLKTLTNLRVLNAENNKISDTNIHKKIFSYNLPTISTINQTFIKSEDLQVIISYLLSIYIKINKARCTEYC